jgi:hypothetical protein
MIQKTKFKTTFFLALTALVVFVSACSSTADDYEELLNAEKKSIEDFIKRNNITVIDQLPEGDFAPNEFYRTSSGLYINIVRKGEGTTAVRNNQQVLARYYKITLEAQPDTIVRNWDTSGGYTEPDSYYYNYNTYEFPAFHEAFGLMKYHDSEAKLIVPSKIGTSADKDDVIPYFYHLKIKLGE